MKKMEHQHYYHNIYYYNHGINIIVNSCLKTVEDNLQSSFQH